MKKRQEPGRGRIVIIECISSSVNYISDIREIGYEPVLMEFWVPDRRRKSSRQRHDEHYSLNGDPVPEIIQAPQDYAAILELMKNLDPVLIIPGSDWAIDTAMKLSADLGLTGNAPEIISPMRDKSVTQSALKKAGLRYIDTLLIHTIEDALQFFHKKGDGPVIIKRERGISSIGVILCRTEEEITEAIKGQCIFFNDGSFVDKVIIQEYIDGTEYVVDTISCRGEHRTIFALQYRKQLLNGSRKIYDVDEYIDSDAEEYRYLSDYMFKVLDAIGITYGPTHSEIMVDEKGPVLIEVNCRPAGTSVKRSYQDRILGCHETREALDAYLDPDSFQDKINTFGRYGHLRCPAMVKNMIMPETVFVKRLKYNETAGKLKSFVYMLTNGENCIYEKTIDLGNTAGMIYLANEDEEQLKKDCEYLQQLEKNDLGALYDYEMPPDHTAE